MSNEIEPEICVTEAQRLNLKPTETSLLLDPIACTAKAAANYTAIQDTNSSPTIDTRPFYKRAAFWLKISIVMILATIFFSGVIYYEQVLDYFIYFLQWIKEEPIEGIFAYLLFCWIYLALFGPETLLTVGGGFVFTHVYGTKGLPISIALVFVGSQIGAIQAFFNGRYLMRNCTERLAYKYPQFKVIDKIVEQHGLKIAFLLRLTFLTPYNVMNYLMGLTNISLLHYVLGNFGMLPDCIMMCCIGSFLSSVIEIKHVSQNLSRAEKKAILILSIVGTIIAFVVAVYVAIIAKRQFRKFAKEIELENQRENEIGDHNSDVKL